MIRGVILALSVLLWALAGTASAANVAQMSDVVSDSGPGEASNHTLRFSPTIGLSASSYFEVQFPADYHLSLSSTSFAVRNVELLVDGTPRTATTSPSAGVDGVTITRGSGGTVRYTLAPDVVIAASSSLELRIGNNTTGTLGVRDVFIASSGTTTLPADIEPIQNATSTGLGTITMSIVDGVEVANATFIVFRNQKVNLLGDTTEEIPPFRFNGQPTSTIAGTSLFVEISLETDEFASCRYSTASGTPFASMPNPFDNTGLIVHTTDVAVTPNSLAQFYVRCIDDEGNFNTDDFVIEFTVNATPTGTSNTTGSTSGDGTGSGNEGSGDGEGSGGTTGASDGDTNESGNETGGGGSGGGSGGGGGGGSGSGSGGGFETTDGPFESGDARIIISGYAFPDADVTILADGQFVDDISADNDGEYSITIDEIARGAYTFGVYATDQNGVITSTFSTSFTVSGARASRLSNVNLTPTISVSPDPSEPGEVLTISGYALPDATITLESGQVGTANTISLTAVSDGNGLYTTTLDTTGFARDTYQIRASAEQVGGVSTNVSDYYFYGVGQEADQPVFADLNRDGFVNLIDFSIMLFWWQTNGGDSDPPADINQDGTVSLTDFSILLFNWTG